MDGERAVNGRRKRTQLLAAGIAGLRRAGGRVGGRVVRHGRGGFCGFVACGRA
jgi:hypothetical protein